MNFSRRLMIALVSVALIFFVFILLKASKKRLNTKFDVKKEVKEEERTYLKVNAGNVAKDEKSTTIDSETGMTSNKLLTASSTSMPRENKFKDMHKFSVYNPRFRSLMEWPPFTLTPHTNPNLENITGQEIKPEFTNWKKFNYKISKLYIYEENSPIVENLLKDMETLKIVAVDIITYGMQFKFYVTFEDGSHAVMKPKRYAENHPNMHPNILYFSDYERHWSEIAAFHLDRILGFRRVAPTTGRRVNITSEIYPLIHDEKLLDTFFYSPDGNYCFTGLCRMYCDTHHGFCGEPDMIDVSLTTWLITEPKSFLINKFIRSPWKRTYILNKKAAWESDPFYCANVVREKHPFIEGRRIYDVVDCAIFDYLIGNWDRHSYQEFWIFGNDSTSNLILLDNGRGFGQPYHDEDSILQPLLQCCTIRLSTFNKLYEFHIGTRPLSDIMRESLAKDPLSPVLSESHLQALDRRLDKVLASIRSCATNNPASAVFLDDLL